MTQYLGEKSNVVPFSIGKRVQQALPVTGVAAVVENVVALHEQDIHFYLARLTTPAEYNQATAFLKHLFRRGSVTIGRDEDGISHRENTLVVIDTDGVEWDIPVRNALLILEANPSLIEEDTLSDWIQRKFSGDFGMEALYRTEEISDPSHVFDMEELDIYKPEEIRASLPDEEFFYTVSFSLSDGTIAILSAKEFATSHNITLLMLMVGALELSSADMEKYREATMTVNYHEGDMILPREFTPEKWKLVIQKSLERVEWKYKNMSFETAWYDYFQEEVVDKFSVETV